METGIELIAKERQRQLTEEGRSLLGDQQFSSFQLSAAAACYVASGQNKYLKELSQYDDMGDLVRFQMRELETRKWEDGWPFETYDKREQHDTMKSLIIAGALIAAEIDRLSYVVPPFDPKDTFTRKKTKGKGRRVY